MAKQQGTGERNWYAIHTYSGYENAVARNLKQRIDSLNMNDKIFNVVVPTEKKIRVKGGKRVTEEERRDQGGRKVGRQEGRQGEREKQRDRETVRGKKKREREEQWDGPPGLEAKIAALPIFLNS